MPHSSIFFDCDLPRDGAVHVDPVHAPGGLRNPPRFRDIDDGPRVCSTRARAPRNFDRSNAGLGHTRGGCRMATNTSRKIESEAPLVLDGQRLDREPDLEHLHIEIDGSTRRGRPGRLPGRPSHPLHETIPHSQIASQFSARRTFHSPPTAIHSLRSSPKPPPEIFDPTSGPVASLCLDPQLIITTALARSLGSRGTRSPVMPVDLVPNGLGGDRVA